MPYIETNTLPEHLLAILCSARSVRLYHEILRDMRIKRYKRNAVDTALSRMKKRGWILKTGDSWHVTENGKNAWDHINRFMILPSPFPKGAPAKNIIAFDIPEPQRRERVWLRDQLKAYGYTMLQKSLWRGPGPLPDEFTKKTKALDIASGIKTFIISGK